MSKKSASQKRAQRQQEERAALNNIFTTFLVGLVAECYLFIVHNNYITGTIQTALFWHDFLKILMWVGLAALIGGAGFAIWKKNNEKLRKIGILSAATGVFFTISGWVMTNFFDVGVITMCAAVPVVTILVLIYFLYQRDCFLNTILLAGALFTLWVCDRGLDGGWKTYITIGVIAVAVALAVLCILVRRMQVSEGKLGKLQLLPDDCDYRMIYIVAAAAVALIVAALVVPGYIYYLIWAAVIALFAELAYYTAKMM